MVKISKLINLKAKLVLASKSPRRIKLLKELGFDIIVQSADIDEDISTLLPPPEYVMILSRQKAKSVAQTLDFPAIVIGSDTTVVLDGQYLNKPANNQEAFAMLKTLSGRTHQVFTGIAIIEGDNEIIDFQVTNVSFRKLDDDEIWAYIESGSPMDKAGAYGIQDDFGAVFVERIEGCYYNIVGLPLELLYRKLRENFNVDKI